MIIDMHVHEQTHSSDSRLELGRIVARAKAMGLDGVCITDHESNALAATARRVSRETGFPLFVGAEILTWQGDLLVYGLDRIPSGMLDAEELVSLVNRAGGAAVSAHPFRQNNRGMGKTILDLEGLAGVEVLNGSTPYQHNRMAMKTARQADCALLGGSDAHHLDQLGRYATRFGRTIRSMEDLICAIREGDCDPVIYHGGHYQPMTWDRPLEWQAVS